jgi:hypothetical protein
MQKTPWQQLRGRRHRQVRWAQPPTGGVKQERPPPTCGAKQRGAAPTGGAKQGRCRADGRREEDWTGVTK